MKIKYSIIIPIYNSSKMLSRCLDSILNQKNDNYEILLVNDGSTDSSAQICKEYQEKYCQIQYYEQSNCGVSVARNLGLKYAKGKYVMFVDSDDYVCRNYFSEIENLLQENVELLMFGKLLYDGKIKYKKTFQSCSTNTIKTTTKLMSDALKKQLLNSVWNKVYLREIIEANNIRFNEELSIGEDKVFVVEYITHIEKAIIVNIPLYVVSVENRESLSRKSRENLCGQILKEHETLFDIVSKSRLPEEEKDDLFESVGYSYFRSAYTVMSEIYKFDYSRIQRQEKLQQICDIYTKRQRYSFSNIETRIIAFPVKKQWIKMLDIVLQRKRERK